MHSFLGKNAPQELGKMHYCVQKLVVFLRKTCISDDLHFAYRMVQLCIFTWQRLRMINLHKVSFAPTAHNTPGTPNLYRALLADLGCGFYARLVLLCIRVA